MMFLLDVFCLFVTVTFYYGLEVDSEHVAAYLLQIMIFLAQLVHIPAMELKGHRSIVNQVRFSANYNLIVSCGVEKIVKLWSPWPMDNVDPESVRTEVLTRPLYTQQEYQNMVVHSGQPIQGGSRSDSMEEDLQTIAFFDTLILVRSLS
ncbi:unnamed protein product [Soboliphyme baturini]|uniref:WD_REPEATS_REGION domain-containing protein n=1 Tax=Soboliphyme baturini TaxID=241478 RepID=A0A183IMT8_9BILA|nr:unnamed protein product [Soboliphyme baturini]